MSSHHFVKEGQEPALFILDEISLSAIEALLEWVPLILVADRVLDLVSKWGIKIDVILKQKCSSKELEQAIEAQTPVRVLQYEGDVLSEGLKFLAEEKHHSVNLICHSFEERFHAVEKFSDQLQIAIYTETEKWLHVKTGRFEKWLPEHTSLRFQKNDVSFFKVEGIVRKEQDWETTYNGLVVIESESAFWIKETYGATR